MNDRQLSLAYVVSRFPALTETFVVREMDAVRSHGPEIHLYPLVVQDEVVPSELSRRWAPRVHTRPWLSASVVRADLIAARRNPRGALRLGSTVVGGHVRSPSFLGRALALAPKAVAFGEDMRARGTDHVHAHFGAHAALAAMLAARAAGTTFSFTVHAFDLYLDTTFLATKVRAAAFVATISEFNRQLLAELAPDAADRVHVVRCGASEESLAIGASRPAAEDKPTLQVLSVAQLAPYKGLRYLVEAAALLRRTTPGLTVTIVGDGAERQALETLRAELGLEDVVTFVGAVSPEQVAEYLRAADIFVLPSIRQPDGLMDGIPVALMEAMASGLPVVASRLSGIPELVVDGETGLLAEPGDAADVARAVQRLADVDLRRRLQLAGRRHVAREFGVEHNARRLLALFETAVRR